MKSQAKKRHLARAKSVSFDSQKETMHLKLILTFLLAALFLASRPVKGAEGQVQPPSSEARNLETLVWSGEESEFPDIENRITHSIQIDPKSSYNHYLMAHFLIRKFTNNPSDLSLLRKASEMGQQAIELDGSSEFGYLTIAEILDIMGQTDNGLKILDSLRSAGQSVSWRYHFTKSRLMADRSTNSDIIENLKIALNSENSNNEIIAPYMVSVMQNEFSNDKLISELMVLNQAHPNKLFLDTIAKTFAEEKKYQKAHDIYKALIHLYPDYIEAQINDSIILYQNLNHSDQARTQLTNLLVKFEKKLSPLHASIVHEHLGMLSLNSREPKLAENHFLNALKESDNALEVLDTISKSYRRHQKSKELVALIDRIESQTPGLAIHHALKGEVLSEDLRNHKLALKSFANAILLEPDRSEFYNGMGLTYYRMSDLSNALSMFSTAIKVDPQDATARYNEACVLARLGQKNKALGSLKEALSLNPQLQDSAQKDGDFENIRAMAQFEDLMHRLPQPALRNDEILNEESEEVLGH